MGHFNSSFPPGAASEGTKRQIGMNPDAFKAPMLDGSFRSKYKKKGQHAGHIGRTTINPGAPMTHHPHEIGRRVNSLFGTKVH